MIARSYDLRVTTLQTPELIVVLIKQAEKWATFPLSFVGFTIYKYRNLDTLFKFFVFGADNMNLRPSILAKLDKVLYFVCAGFGHFGAIIAKTVASTGL